MPHGKVLWCVEAFARPFYGWSVGKIKSYRQFQLPTIQYTANLDSVCRKAECLTDPAYPSELVVSASVSETVSLKNGVGIRLSKPVSDSWSNRGFRFANRIDSSPILKPVSLRIRNPDLLDRIPHRNAQAGTSGSCSIQRCRRVFKAQYLPAAAVSVASQQSIRACCTVQ